MSRRFDLAMCALLLAAPLAGLALFAAEFYGARVSNATARQHRAACLEQGRGAHQCCVVDGALICPLQDTQP